MPAARQSSSIPNEDSYRIWLVYEDGRAVSQVVWRTMHIRDLCVRIGEQFQVPPDTVFCYFAGSILDVERQIADPPTIGNGAQVHVFFTIANALRFVVHSMQGGTPPPTTPPPTPPGPPGPQPFGPTVPPGFNRVVPLVKDLGTAPRHTESRDRTSASDHLRNTFKCPKFLGDSRHWKTWNQGFIRFLSINKLDHVIEEGFLGFTLTPTEQDENKLVYYILEDAVSGSSVASKYVRRAAVWNDHEAYFFLYDGYALSGPASAAILLGELSHFRFKTDETPSEVVLCLQEFFDDLESIPGSAAMILNDTQKINYLLSAIRPERYLASVFSQIQTGQVRGIITFSQACEDLRYRCEALRADDLLAAANQPLKVRGMIADVATPPTSSPASTAALITTVDKRQNRQTTATPAKKTPTVCLVKGCENATSHNLRLCTKCYHECTAGKSPTLLLKSGDKVVFDTTTQKIVFPTSGPAGPRSIIKAAVTFVAGSESD